MKVKEITIETIRLPDGSVEKDVLILWTEDGIPHTVPDVCLPVAYYTRLAENENFEIVA